MLVVTRYLPQSHDQFVVGKLNRIYVSFLREPKYFWCMKEKVRNNSQLRNAGYAYVIVK